MAVKYDQTTDGPKSSTPTPRASLTNGTSARKYVAKDLVKNHDAENTRVRSNAEHLINHATGIRTTALVAAQAAQVARDRLLNVRSAIATTIAQPKTDNRTPSKVADSFDLNLEKKQVATAISTALRTPDTNVQNKVEDAATALINHGVDALLPSYASSLVSVANAVVPEIEHITIEMDKKKGTVDCFFAQVVFNLSKKLVAAGNIRAIRIFRAEIKNPNFTRDIGRLSHRGVETLRADKNRTRAKNQDYLSNIEKRLQESGVDNAITALNPIDPFRKLRTAADESTAVLNVPPPLFARPTADDRATLALGPYIADPNPFIHLDKSVIENLNVLANIQRSNPELIPVSPIPPDAVSLGNKIHPSAQLGTEHLRQNRLENQNKTPLAVTSNNSQGYREIAFMSPDKISSEIVGDFIQYTFEDQSISYARAYRYYIVTVDNNLRESVRSKFVEIHVDGLRIPAPPKRVTAHIIGNFISLTMVVDDQLVEKFEIYRKDQEPGLKQLQAKEVTHVAGRDGFTHQKSIVPRGANGYQLIAESLNSLREGGATHYDRDVVRGRRYAYRVYAVDIFGNKSHMPKEVELFVPDPEHRGVELDAPTITAEVDTATNKARVTFKSEDPRVVALFLSRRDLSVRQSAFTAPSEVNALKLGYGDHARGQGKFEDVLLTDPQNSITWNGYFKNDASGSAQVFIDKTVGLDRYYQYQVYGVDRYGNQSPYAFSKRIFILFRPQINFPLNLNAEISYGEGAIVQGIKLDWEDGNHDITSEERLGDRDELNRRSVRSLFQLERRKVGEQQWFQFPLSEQKSYFDPTEQGVQAARPTPPGFRPDFVEINEQYEYRVSTLQSGGYFSNLSPSVQIFVNSPIKPPVDFRIKAADPKVRPFYLMLNWTTDASSAIVDKWEIERVEMDNAAGDRINTRNLSELAALDYKPFTSVFAESSRFSAKTMDDASTRSKGRISSFQTSRIAFGPELFRMTKTRGSAFGANLALSRFAQFNPQLPPPPPPAALRQGNGTIVGDHHFQDSTVQFGNTYFYRIRAHTPHGDVSEWIYRGAKVTESIIEIKNDIFLGPTYVKDPPKVNTIYTNPVSRPVHYGYPPSFSYRPTVVAAPPASYARANTAVHYAYPPARSVSANIGVRRLY